MGQFKLTWSIKARDDLRAEITGVSAVDQDGRRAAVLANGTACSVIIDTVFHHPVSQPRFPLVVRASDGTVVCDTTAQWQAVQTPDLDAGERCQVEFDLKTNLLPGIYELGAHISSSGNTHYYDQKDSAVTFGVTGTEVAKGLADLEARVRITPTLGDPQGAMP